MIRAKTPSVLNPPAHTSSNFKTWQDLDAVSPHYVALLRNLQRSDDRTAPVLPPALGITGCQRGEGVSTVAANLALAAVKILSGPVLLVDANTEWPCLGRMFRVRSDKGLANALVGQESAFNCVVESTSAGLSVLLPGRLEDGRLPAYDAASVDELLDSLKHVFEMIVVDLPPVTELTTCLSLAGRLDGVLLVVGAERVRRDLAHRATEQLADVGARMLGVVLNQSR